MASRGIPIDMVVTIAVLVVPVGLLSRVAGKAHRLSKRIRQTNVPQLA